MIIRLEFYLQGETDNSSFGQIFVAATNYLMLRLAVAESIPQDVGDMSAVAYCRLQ